MRNINLTEEELTRILDEAFQSGRNSYVEWSGQPDTCDMNVNEDKKEFLESTVNYLFDKNLEDNEKI